MTVKKLGSIFLKPSEVEDGDIFLVTGTPKLVESNFSDKNGKPRMNYQIEVKMPNGTDRSVTLNHTSSDVLLLEFGTDETSWLNRKIAAKKMNQKLRGTDTVVLYFTAVKTP